MTRRDICYSVLGAGGERDGSGGSPESVCTGRGQQAGDAPICLSEGCWRRLSTADQPNSWPSFIDKCGPSLQPCLPRPPTAGSCQQQWLGWEKRRNRAPPLHKSPSYAGLGLVGCKLGLCAKGALFPPTPLASPCSQCGKMPCAVLSCSCQKDWEEGGHRPLQAQLSTSPPRHKPGSVFQSVFLCMLQYN